jgi:hypothetical protein
MLDPRETPGVAWKEHRMSRARIAVGLAALGLVALACGRDNPAGPGLHTLSGSVRLIGHLVDASGAPVGTRTVTDADGVQVELLYGTQVVARTATLHGRYAFRGLGAGAYKVRTQVIGPVQDVTGVLTMTETDLVSGDTLELDSYGDIYPVPNPVVSETMLYFGLADTTYIEVQIRDAAGDSVRTLLRAKRPPGLNQLRWDGLDWKGAPANAPIYWAVLSAGADTRAQLLFR